MFGTCLINPSSSGISNLISVINSNNNPEYLKLSDFSLQPITEVYNSVNNGAEIYFLNSNNEPVRVDSISKEKYSGKIYDVDVANDIILVKRKNSQAVWSGNSESYSQNTFDLKILNGSVEFDYIVDPNIPAGTWF
ncbi:MAG: hypothetical protein AABY06_01740, partial [Nanoarchaeota archaeon]